MLSSITSNKHRAFLVVALVTLTVLSYVLHSTEIKITVFGNYLQSFRKQSEEADHDFDSTFIENRICQGDKSAVCTARLQQRRKKEAVEEMLKRLDQQMPSVTFSDVQTTTSAKNSTATLLSRKDPYCVGDHLTVRLDMYDHLGSRKAYGGDFLRARIYSPSLKAGASGHIEDYRNGTYLVNFTLFWEGDVRVSLLLIHPSEGVSAMWAARKKGYEKIGFTGRFLNGTTDVLTECGFNLTTKAELCEYLDERDQEAFYCVKPNHVPCDSFIYLQSKNKPVSYLTALEKSLFTRSNIGVEIPQTFGDIHVSSCNRSEMRTQEKCRLGMESTLPSGYVLKDAWYPEFCALSDFSTLDKIQACLKRKIIYLMGDSTLRQWIYFLSEKVKTLKFIDCHGSGVFRTHLLLDPERNTFVQWRKHSHPFVTQQTFSRKDEDYVPRVIDREPGSTDTVIVITLGQHFRPFPMHIFARRMLNVREAIQRLHLRSPGTKVIVKGENTREMYGDTERMGDVHGYPQYRLTRDIFRGLNVGFLDAWDMTIAYGTNQLHPPNHVIWNQIVMFLTYICNRTTARQKCTIGMSSPTPSGFVWRSWWHPVFCTTSRLNTSDQINACLKKKLIYFMGDSTVRQWMEYLTRRVKTLKLFDMHGFGHLQNLFAVDMTRNIQIQWKKHGHPFIGSSIYTVKDHRYVPQDLDTVAGDRDTAVVISLGQHFRPLPMELFLRRMLNVRAAIQRLLLRSPDTKVIIKAENVREMNVDQERFGDIHGYTQSLALRDIFRDLRVGFIDAWDMSIACAVNNVHPPEEVVAHQIDMFLTYIC